MQDRELDQFRNFYLGVGLIAAISGTWMAYSFGNSISKAHGITFALLTLAVAGMPARIAWLQSNGRKSTARTLTAICSLFLVAEYGSHLGYTISNQTDQIEQIGFHNKVKLENEIVTHKDHRADLERFTARQKELVIQRTALVTANPQSAQANVVGIKAELVELTAARDREGARTRCGTKCETLSLKVVEAEKRLAAAMKSNEIDDEIKKIDGMIASTVAVLDVAKKEINKTGTKTSTVLSQTKFVGQLWSASLEPDAETMNWTKISIGALIAAITTFLAPTCFHLAFPYSPGSSHGFGGSQRALGQQTASRMTKAGADGQFDVVAARSAALPPHTTNTISVIDGGGDLVRQITELCRKQSDKAMAA
jgi:hypothetical protein